MIEKFMQDILSFQDLTGTFSVIDIVLSMLLSFGLTTVIGLVYMKTHKGTSYTQSYVHTLVLMGMITSIIMIIVGSNIARAFSLVGALSIIRFRNAVKETRDVGFIFFAMAIGMATGTKFYLLAIIVCAMVCVVTLIMNRFNWFSRNRVEQILKIYLPNDTEFETVFDDTFVKYTDRSELISVDSVRSGMLTELVYSISMKKKAGISQLLNEVKKLNGNNKATLVTGYHSTDL